MAVPPTSDNSFASGPAGEDAGRLSLSDSVSHALYVTPGYISSSKMPDQWFDVSSNPPFIDF
jgi:hypothetical protein